MKQQNEWEKLFESFLEVTEFALIKHEDGWGLLDLQGADLGDISDDRFENAAEIFDRMDIYINDYFYNDIEANILEENETWDDIEDLIGILGAKLDSDLSDDMRQTIEYEYHILCMIAHHAGEIDLENICCYDKYRFQVVDYSDPRDPCVLFETNDEDEAIEYCEQANEACYHAFVEEVE